MKTLFIYTLFTFSVAAAYSQQPVLARPCDLHKTNYGLFCGYRFDWSDNMATAEANAAPLLSNYSYDSLSLLLRSSDFWQQNQAFPLNYLRKKFSLAADSLRLNGMGKVAMVYRVISSSFSDYSQNNKNLLSAFVLMDEWAADASLSLGCYADKIALLGNRKAAGTSMRIGFDFLNGNWQLDSTAQLQVLPVSSPKTDITYETMLLEGNQHPHFPQQKTKQHQVSFSFEGNTYKIRYKTDSVYVSYLNSLPYLPDAASRTDYTLSPLCEKSLAASLLPLLEQWKSNKEKMLFLQAFANELSRNRAGQTPSNLRFAECILHEKGDGKDNAAIVATCLYQHFVKNKEPE